MNRHSSLNIDVNLDISFNGNEIIATNDGDKLIIKAKKIKGLMSFFNQHHYVYQFQNKPILSRCFNSVEIKLGRLKLGRLLQQKGLLPFQFGGMWLHLF